MTRIPFHLTVHMVASVDGYIADRDNSVGWFETTSDYPAGATGEDPEAFLKTIDCYVMGSRTYEHALALSRDYGWAYGDKPTVVLTHRSLPKANEHVDFYTGDLSRLVNEQLRPRFGHVWVAGGAITASEFIRLQLVDELRISILPVLLGGGRYFFEPAAVAQSLTLLNAVAYRNGMVELRYAPRR